MEQRRLTERALADHHIARFTSQPMLDPRESMTARPIPCPTPEPPPIIAPRDTPYVGVLGLEVDATDTTRGILSVRETIPVSPGPMTLLYPKWIPGYHSPQNPLELFAGLEIRIGDEVLPWRRDPVEVYAFHLEIPESADAIEATFQFLTPTNSAQGDVVVTSDLMNLQWGRMVLYPAGHFSRQIRVQARLKLPDRWNCATVLEALASERQWITFETVTLDVLVDSPVMAGRLSRDVPLDDDGAAVMVLFGHAAEHLDPSEAQIEPHRALVAQARRLFGSRHYDRYRFLVALSDELGGGGVEHHRSAEIVAPPNYFTEWDRAYPTRDVFGHEFTHSWNGKFRRGADSWTPSFERPIRNSLMWVYEGQTQYWGHVLTARSGLWSSQSAMEALAKVAATYDVRPGGMWRTMADTTRDPIIVARAPLPWPSWQRNEDYYSEGQLLWLAVDTLLREKTGDRRCLDDFAQAFFGIEDGRMTTLTYVYEDVIETLNRIAPHDWRSFFDEALESREPGAPLEGLERGGYRLVYRDHRTEFCRRYDAFHQQFDLRFSVGLTMSADGEVLEVMWGSAAFDAGLTAGSRIKSVEGRDYGELALRDAISEATNGAPIRLELETRGRTREVELAYSEGHRFPHLEPISGARARLDEILAPRASC
jgi:predicted metalloprotease with PDZ domain